MDGIGALEQGLNIVRKEERSTQSVLRLGQDNSFS